RGAAARGRDQRQDRREGRYLHRTNHAGTSSLALPSVPLFCHAGSPVMAYVYRMVRGSSASRRPSPTRLNASVVRNRKSPGNTTTPRAPGKIDRAAESILPHDGVVAAPPTPRNESAASNRMLFGMMSVVNTSRGATPFGSPSRNMMRTLLAPAA